MKNSVIRSAILFACMPLSAQAAPTDIVDCKHIDDDQQRLACYDAALKVPNEKNTEPVIATPAKKAASESAIPAKHEPAAEPQELGAEQLKKPTADSIEARLLGDFTGWSGQTIFKLDNGQEWQQTRNYVRNYRPNEPVPAARVTISKGMFGNYNLRVDGVKRVIQVKRIK